MTTLYEKYRPRVWSDVVGQDKAIAKLTTIKDRLGLLGKAFYMTGKSGNGKTTIAKIIADEVADEWDIEELDATDLTPQKLQDIEYTWKIRGMGKGGRAYIINEAHALKKAAVSKLLVMLERIPPHVVIIFTTTCDGLDLFEDHVDAHPFLSRCHVIPLAQRDVTQPMAERLKWIAEQENLDGKPISEYVALLRRKDVGNNMRKAIQLIAEGVMLHG